MTDGPPASSAVAHLAHPAGVSRRRRVPWLVIFVITAGLLVRGALCFLLVPWWEHRVNVPPAPDSYPALAQTLLTEGTLGFGPEGATPTTVRAPAFPAWLAVGILVGGRGFPWLGLWASLPGVLVGAGLASWTARRFGILAGAGAGFVAVLHPLPALISARCMADEFTAATGMGAILAWTCARDAVSPRSAWKWAILAGSLLSVHALSRASGLITVVCIIGAGLLSRRPPLRMTIALCALSLLPAIAWSIRSSVLGERPVVIQSLGSYNFWVGEAVDKIPGGDDPKLYWRDVSSIVLRETGDPSLNPETFHYTRLTPKQAARLDNVLQRAAVAHVEADPTGYAARVLRGMGAFWYRAQTTGRSRLYLFLALPVLLLAAVGTLHLLRARRFAGFATLLVTVILMHNLAYAATLPMARMSVQIYLEMALLAGVGLSVSMRWRRSKRLGEQEANPSS